jgi:hypothetical protein
MAEQRQTRSLAGQRRFDQRSAAASASVLTSMSATTMSLMGLVMMTRGQVASGGSMLMAAGGLQIASLATDSKRQGVLAQSAALDHLISRGRGESAYDRAALTIGAAGRYRVNAERRKAQKAAAPAPTSPATAGSSPPPAAERSYVLPGLIVGTAIGLGGVSLASMLMRRPLAAARVTAMAQSAAPTAPAAYMSPAARTASAKAAPAAAPAARAAPAAKSGPATRSAYTTKDGRTVQATEKQAAAWAARKK